MLRHPLIALVHCYRRCISPWTPACCRFEPTCSAYALQVLRRHGACKGLLLITWRLLRCQPFGRGGYDPAPERGCWHHPDRHLDGDQGPACPDPSHSDGRSCQHGDHSH